MASVKIRNRPTRDTTPAEWVGVEFVGDAGHPTWHGRRFKILPQSTSNAPDREGMVLDLSELPEHVSLMIEGCGTLWWAELRVASEATEGEGATAAEAYNAALKAWKKRKG